MKNFLIACLLLLTGTLASQTLRNAQDSIIGYITPDGTAEDENHVPKLYFIDGKILTAGQKQIGAYKSTVKDSVITWTIEALHNKAIGYYIENKSGSVRNIATAQIGFVRSGQVLDYRKRPIARYEGIQPVWAAIYFFFLDELN